MMRKSLVTVLSLIVGVMMTTAVFATDYSVTVTPGNGIKGTAHDLSLIGAATAGRANTYGSNDSANAYLGNPNGANLDRICVWCHAPHNTMKLADAAGINYLPLWNHGVTAQTYITYSNGPEDPADPNHLSVAEQLAGQPGSVSRLCLSCHDGTVAVNEYGLAPGDTKSSGTRKGDAAQFMAPQYRIGSNGDLSNHHPIGFDYIAVAATDDEIQNATEIMVGTTTIGDLLWNGQMECTTCHDVHNTKNTGEKFLWKTDFQSEFCLTCHLKGSVKKTP